MKLKNDRKEEKEKQKQDSNEGEDGASAWSLACLLLLLSGAADVPLTPPLFDPLFPSSICTLTLCHSQMSHASWEVLLDFPKWREKIE